GVLGLGTELSTASAMAGSQRYFLEISGSRRAVPVTDALPPSAAKSFWTLLEVNHSRNCFAASGFFEPDAMPQMNVPIAGPLFSCEGVAAMSIWPTTFESFGSSTRWVRPVYSVSAVHLPWSISCVSWSVSYSATPDGMYGMKLSRRSRAPWPSGPL